MIAITSQAGPGLQDGDDVVGRVGPLLVDGVEHGDGVDAVVGLLDHRCSDS